MSEPGPIEALPFDAALARLVAERRLSYRALGSATGLSAGYLHHLAHGRRPVPPDDVILRIAAALDVDPLTFRDHRLRRVTERLAAHPEIVDRLLVELGDG